MDSKSRTRLELLEAVSQNAEITQRGLARKAGIALGLANLYLKRLARKGYIKCVNVQSNRLRYLLTPTGLAEKTRLTYEFMEYSLRLYRDTRARIHQRLAAVVQRPDARVAIYGTGEAAELAYTCLKEMGIDPIGVFADTAGSQVLSIPAHAVSTHAAVSFDAVIVATLDDPSAMMAKLEQLGIERSRQVPLRPAS